jgi:hypothetical protein
MQIMTVKEVLILREVADDLNDGKDFYDLFFSVPML